jgi:putative tricarboxylic transport membrane protein
LLKRVMDTPEFRAYLNDGALKPAWLTGPELTAWMEKQDGVHHDLMEKGGLLKK